MGKKEEFDAKVAETRRTGCFDAEIPESGFPIDLFLEFVTEMFPGVSHENLFILKTEEGKICVASERPVVAH